MKNLIRGGLFLFTFTFMINMGFGKTLIWRYGNPEQRSWARLGTNDYGGVDYWCVGDAGGCGRYDWKTVYGIKQQQPLSPYLQSPQYAIDQMVANASVAGIVLPDLSEFANPDIEIIEGAN